MQVFGINLEQSLTPLSGYLSGITRAQEASASNIANINTPGYKPKRVSLAASVGLGSSPFETTLAQKMGGGSYLDTALAGGDGGEGDGVNLQQELMTVQKQALYFNLVSKRLSTVVTNLKAAGNIGR
jgi:flagellar basal body rod protein FlgB